ncbi:TetR/AcrR family transcriptional regulator [Microbacterium flavescens]|uniref:TetR/AcrR family transcriptional regulator n=1 Tax=Microbacterium flavescens TaxID=69366 RepID=UPI001BDEB5FD|nr:TetR/AcrR family transcriptional regulator [Microbacterium flavescens]
MTDDVPARGKRSDAVRNQRQIIDAAADVFVESGVNAPVRVVAERAGVGVGTLYRNFPTRADLVVAVYRHQVDAAAQAGPVLLRESSSPAHALHAWVDVFVDFLVTKHGLADALQGDSEGFAVLHRYFVDRLVPVCANLLEAARPGGTTLTAYSLLRGIGNLCIGGETHGYEPAQLAHVLVDGLLASTPDA